MGRRVRKRPNGLPFSCRERWECLSKPNDLVREAVGCNGLFGLRAGQTVFLASVC
jgi:hypothetical protein